jgi:hypothetical protein
VFLHSTDLFVKRNMCGKIRGIAIVSSTTYFPIKFYNNIEKICCKVQKKLKILRNSIEVSPRKDQFFWPYY